MKIEFTGRQTEIPAALRGLAERKLGKVKKLLPSITRAHVILTAEKHRQTVEIGLHSRQLDLSAVEVSTNPRLALSGAVDKLLRQAHKQGSRRRQRKGGLSPRLAQPAAEAGKARGGPRVIRTRRALVKPMTLDEAALEMEGRAEGIVVYRDAASDRVQVLFRRKDGNLGLLEPEA